MGSMGDQTMSTRKVHQDNTPEILFSWFQSEVFVIAWGMPASLLHVGMFWQFVVLTTLMDTRNLNGDIYHEGDMVSTLCLHLIHARYFTLHIVII